jgi:branched-subunit amino acid transport protein
MIKHRRFHVQPARGRLGARREALVWTVLGVVWASGVAWLVVRYGLRARGEFGELPHPLEPWWMRVHGAAAMAALWLGGLLWAVHVLPAWRAHRRISGIVLGVILATLAASGYLLYYLGDEGARSSVALVHWIVGLAVPLPFLVHALRRRGGVDAHATRNRS